MSRGARGGWQLGAAIAVLMPALSAAAQPFVATPPSETAGTPAFRAKKDRYLDEKAAARSERDAEADAAARQRWHAELDRRLGATPEPLINIYNTWTHETLVHTGGKTRSGADDGVDKALTDRFLRCHFTNDPADMDPRLFTHLVRAARHFRVSRIEIISGYRAGKYNLMLRKKGRNVARESQHTMGHAVDFRLPGIPTRRLRDWVARLRMGGVGYYPGNGFVHMDVGRVRSWTGR